MRRLVALSLALFALTPRAARASDLALLGTLEGSGLSAEGGHQELDIDDELRPGPLHDTKPTIDGTGRMIGAEARYVFLVPAIGLRVGLGSGFYGVEGIVVRNQGLPAGFQLETTSTFAFALEGSLGREFDFGPVVPYLDARFVFEDLVAQIQLRSQDYGFVGKTPFGSTSVGLGPRLGMLVPLGERAFIDMSGTYQMLGPRRIGASAGFGVMIGERESPPPEPASARSVGLAKRP